MNILKFAAYFQLFLAGVRLVIERASWPAVSMMIMGALVMIFCAQEKINDERVEHLKLKAGKAGLLFGTLLVMLVHVVMLASRATQPRSERGRILDPGLPFSAYDVVIVMMLIALGCFYYWRWQDGRAASAE